MAAKNNFIDATDIFIFGMPLFLYKNTLSMRKSCVLRIDTSVAANTKTSALRHNDP